ncbi:hypothetical protein [Herbaspirillum sp. CAH-3]|uniref:hypothetical protein n=1 Tax=Herbaspirillum sp. CAH-3 TaxID=2605746 RepID=UPI0012AD103B|nr:hypothetical protein [Herbaspirillum sp. CAH-3]MRT30791.1 hypothetical protein [Herbaspirillum sp. CAH-3]
MKQILAIVVTTGVLAACAPNQVVPYRGSQYKECMDKVAADPKFAPLAAKTSLGQVAKISTSMLADNSIPTDQERDLIAKWADSRDRCFVTYTSTLKEDLPPEAFAIAQVSVNKAKLLAADMNAGKMTFAQFNRLRISQNSETESGFEQVRQLYAARQDDENQRRRQVLLMQLQSQLNKPAPAPMPAPYMVPMPAPTTSTTNCTTIGNQVNCVSR